MLFAALYVLLCTSCSRLFLYPSSDIEITPDKISVSYSAVSIKDPRMPTLKGWLLKPGAAARGYIVQLHGNANNISNHLSSVYWLPKNGYYVLLIDYRGYGLSEGAASLDGAIEDVERILDYALADTKTLGLQDATFILGQSLGGSMLCYVASKAKYQNRFAGIVIEGAFSSYREIFREKAWLSWLTGIPGYLLSFTIPSDIDPVDHIGKLSPTPLLIVHSKDDSIVYFHHGQALYNAALPPKFFLPLEGDNHGGGFNAEANRANLTNWLFEGGSASMRGK